MAGRSGGFTLLELLIVVMLMALLSSAFLPNLGGSFGFRLRDASREIAGELDYVSQRAIATGVSHRWELNLDAQRFRVQRLEELPAEVWAELPTHSELLDLAPPRPQQDYIPIENRAGEWRALQSNRVRIDEVRLAHERLTAGSAVITFAPDGGADSAELWLQDDNGLELRIRVLAFTGELRIDLEATRE